jgi:DNA topoisomerase VI subunit A
MAVRERRPSRRVFRKAFDFWVNMFVVGHYLMEVIADRKPKRLRGLQYNLRCPRAKGLISLAKIKTTIETLALSLNIHPYLFGISTQESGTVLVPRGLNIEVRYVSQVFDWADSGNDVDGTAWATLSGGRCHKIPFMALEIKRLSKAKLSAVIVVEHISIIDDTSAYGLYFERVLLVATSGYPSRPTLEFLHLLSEASHLRHVPILYFGDHDPHGLHQYLKMKYGSFSSAWCARILVCRRLEWVGPTRQQFQGLLQRMADVTREEEAVTNPSLSDAVCSSKHFKSSCTDR